MNLFSRSIAACVCLVLCGPIAGLAQKGETQDEHDKQIKADTERNTKYHNNADDYPANKSSAPNVPTPPARIPLTPKYTPPPPTENERRVEAARPGMEADFREAAAKANRGEVSAILDTARHYRTGFGVAPSRAKAYELYASIADRDSEAAFQAADIIFDAAHDINGPAGNKGIPVDEALAYTLMNRSALSGYKPAIDYLKYHPQHILNSTLFPQMEAYVDGVIEGRRGDISPTTVQQSDALIAQYGKQKKDGSLDRDKLAKHSRELMNAGKANLYGIGVPVDLHRAYQLLNLASVGGAFGASEQLGWAAWVGKKSDSERGHDLCYVTYEGQGQYDTDPIVDYQRALCSSLRGARTEQRTRLGYAASGGMGYPNAARVVPQAITDLAVMQMQGEGGQIDVAQGLVNLKNASDKGERNAQYLLGRIYAEGNYGLPKDPAKAAQLLQAAANAGQVGAKEYLAKTAH